MTKHLNLRLPDDLHARATAAAADDRRSLNNWIITVIEQALDSGRPRPEPAPREPGRTTDHRP